MYSVKYKLGKGQGFERNIFKLFARHFSHYFAHDSSASGEIFRLIKSRSMKDENRKITIALINAAALLITLFALSLHLARAVPTIDSADWGKQFFSALIWSIHDIAVNEVSGARPRTTHAKVRAQK